MSRSETQSQTGYKFIDGPDAKGKPQHLHTLNGEPLYGTSTVLGVLSKPLTWWASGLACESLGWRNPKIPNSRKKLPMEERITPEFLDRYHQIIRYSPEEFMGCLDDAYKAHNVKLDKAADAGTEMHARLEDYVKTCIERNNSEPMPSISTDQVGVFADWAMDAVGRFEASEAHCYSERLWTGGIVDLLFRGKDDRLRLLDFKSSKEAYHSHFLQNAGYDIALSENGILSKDGDLLFRLDGSIVEYGVFPFGMPEPEPFFRDTVDAHRDGFRACVTLYNLFQGFDRDLGLKK